MLILANAKLRMRPAPKKGRGTLKIRYIWNKGTRPIKSITYSNSPNQKK